MPYSLTEKFAHCALKLLAWLFFFIYRFTWYCALCSAYFLVSAKGPRPHLNSFHCTLKHFFPDLSFHGTLQLLIKNTANENNLMIKLYFSATGKSSWKRRIPENICWRWGMFRISIQISNRHRHQSWGGRQVRNLNAVEFCLMEDDYVGWFIKCLQLVG